MELKGGAGEEVRGVERRRRGSNKLTGNRAKEILAESIQL